MKTRNLRETVGKRLTEREQDRRLGIDTMGRGKVTSDRNAPYEPTDYRVLERLAASGLITKKDRVLDVGCGKGRVVFFLAEFLEVNAKGVDLDPNLIRAAEENRLRYPHPERTEFVCCDAARYGYGGENVLFFFNPFSEKVLIPVLRRIMKVHEENGKGYRLFFYYPTEELVMTLCEFGEITVTGEIDCSDLFDRERDRERIICAMIPGREAYEMRMLPGFEEKRI